jgi:hypothetical protein
MSDIRNLRKQLEAFGEAPVPAPRPEFREALLARILEGARPAVTTTAGARLAASADETDPVIVHLEPVDQLAKRRRSRTLAMQAAAAVSIAAAAAGVVGVVSLVDDGGVPSAEIPAASASFSGEADVKIDRNGRLLRKDETPANLPDGTSDMSCATGMKFYDVSGDVYACAAGETVHVDIVDGAIVSSDATPTVADMELTSQTPEPGEPLEWTWVPYEDEVFDHYELLRVGYEAPARSDLPDSAEVVLRTEAGDASVRSFKESKAPERTSTYQLRAVAEDGRELARSNLVVATVE